MSCTDCTYIHGWLRSLQLPGISLWSNGEFTDSVDGEVAVRKHSAHFNTSQLWWQKLPKRNHHCWDCNTTISAAQLRAAQVAPTSVQSPTETLQEEYMMCVEGDGIGKYQFIYEKLSDNQQPVTLCLHGKPSPSRTNYHVHGRTDLHQSLLLWCTGLCTSWHKLASWDVKVWWCKGTASCHAWWFTIFTLQPIECFMFSSSCDYPCDGVADAEHHVVSLHAGDIDVATF